MILDEYVIVPDVFDAAAYSNAAFIDMCLPNLKEPLLNEALVRDLCDGGWSRYCMANSGSMHRLCKEIVKKLNQGNRLRRFPQSNASLPNSAADWCVEGLGTHGTEELTGVIASHTTKSTFTQIQVASIERLTGTTWWQKRSPSITVERKASEYLRVLHRVLVQANSLMFIDPNLDPSSHNYREFERLLTPIAGRPIKPRIEIHRSFCKGDGPSRKFPSQTEWLSAFSVLERSLKSYGISAEVFFWQDFHDRYLISDVVGISVPAGFDTTTKADEFSTWGRLGRDDKDKIQRLFDPAASGARLKFRFSIG